MGRLATDSPRAWGCPDTFRAPTLTSRLCWSEEAASPQICSWVSFEVDSCLIREILPFVCLSPSCQALFTWTLCSPRVPMHTPFYGMERRYFLTFDWALARVSSLFALPSLPPPRPRNILDPCWVRQTVPTQEGGCGLHQSLFYKYSLSLLKVNRKRATLNKSSHTLKTPVPASRKGGNSD